MKSNKILYRLWQLALIACMTVSLSSCRETFESFFSDDIEEGEEVMFTTSLPNVAVTRASEDEFKKQMSAYTAVSKAYEFTISMFAKGETTAIGTGTYQPASTVTKDENDNEIVKYDKIGTLKSLENKALYWPSTTIEYGFLATAGEEKLSSEQDSKDKWLKQDLLKGYGYIQQYNGTDGGIDKLDDFNYRTANEWKKKNKEIKLVTNEEEYKMIPLYLQHQRALITVKLKAGEGVSSKSLWPSNAAKEVVSRIYSHTKNSPDTTSIKPLARWELEEGGDTIMCYDAIVEPWDYNSNLSDNLITKISLSGQNYSFYRVNDTTPNSDDNYDLAAGKHLTLTITLGRESRKALMTAYIEDWTENVTTTICDDHGNAGEPRYIETRDDLLDFLTGLDNKAGNVGLVLKDINLDSTTVRYPDEWGSYDLRCTLNLGGWKLKGTHCFLNTLESTANLQNGKIQIGANVESAIANTNNGTIDDVKIIAINGAHATVAGAVVENTGSIIKCHSSIEVSGSTAEYVGGIAAKSNTGTTSGKITGCTVTNRVDGGTTACGGIVGLANGDVTNNVFEYGITLSQRNICKNIVGEIVGEHDFSKNSWPTTDANPNLTNAATENLYTGIIDRETEFALATGKRYRLARDFTVSSTKDDVAYELDGNGKTISTSAMIFKTISGQVHDLTINVTKNLEAEHETDDRDVMAPLAEAVVGPTAEINNIVVYAKGITIQASNPAGVVVWAAGGAKVVNCEATANIVAKVVNLTSGERKYAGGIVSSASIATISQCVFHKDCELKPATGVTGAETVYYGGIVGGIGSWNGETPELTITDCASFCESYITTPEDAYHGGVLGYAQKEVNTSYYNATKDCQGNWWPDNGDKISNGVALKGLADGYSVEKTIGKRNAVKPEEKTNK